MVDVEVVGVNRPLKVGAVGTSELWTRELEVVDEETRPMPVRPHWNLGTKVRVKGTR